MRLFAIAGLALFFLPFCVAAQRKDDKDLSDRRSPSSLEPGTGAPEKTETKRNRSRQPMGPVIETEAQYEARMKRTVRSIRKKEKEMKKPQYSDPMYFGHKRPPKKNKAGHLKFCKECGMRH